MRFHQLAAMRSSKYKPQNPNFIMDEEEGVDDEVMLIWFAIRKEGRTTLL